WTPLIWAARSNHSDVVKVLLEAGADPNIANWNFGDDALGWAAYNGHPTIVQDLLNAGADIGHVDNDGDTAFLLAVRSNHLEIARTLLNWGSLVNVQNKDGWNALIQASYNNNTDTLRLVIQAGGSLNAGTAKHGKTINYTCCYVTIQGFFFFCGMKRHGADLGHLARLLGNHEELLAAGAEVDLENNNGYTALSISITRNQPEAAKILLAFGADINQRAKDGDSVLMEAVNLGREAMVEVLLQHCPDMSVENINRKTVFTLARQRFSSQIKDMIQAHESTTCLADGRAYVLGSIKYDSCRQQQCCNSVWRNTGPALESCGVYFVSFFLFYVFLFRNTGLGLESCGNPCNTPGTRLGTCVLVGECVRLEQVFLVTNAAGDVGRTTKFLVDHRCDTRDGNIHVCCPTS
ncbi:hypothetical protein C7M84_012469, partial [Penaeus vannamei]